MSVYAEFDIVAIFDQAPQVADAYRIEVVFVAEAVMVPEAIENPYVVVKGSDTGAMAKYRATDTTVEEVTAVVKNAEVVEVVVVEEVVSHGGGGTSHHHQRHESRCRKQHTDAPHKGGLLYCKGGTRQSRLML